jgi:ABC-type transport system involved in cytochrome bd biosynthesis fused ATPase/permease subunit
VAGLSHSRVTALLTQDVNRAVSATQTLLRIVVLALVMAVNSVIALSLAPNLVALLVVLLAICGVFIWFSQSDAFALGKEMRDSTQSSLERSQNLLSGLRTALAQEQHGWFVTEYERVQQTIYSSQQSFQRRQSGARRLFGVASALVAAGLVYGGVLLAVEPAPTRGGPVMLSSLNFIRRPRRRPA